MTIARPASDSALSTDAAAAKDTLARPTADSALAADAAHSASTLSGATADVALSAEAGVGNARLARPAADSALSGDVAALAPSYSRAASDTWLTSDTAAASVTTPVHDTSDTSLTSDSAPGSLRLARAAVDGALAADTALGAATTPRAVEDAALAADSATITRQGLSRSAGDISLTTDNARTSGHAVTGQAQDQAVAADSVVGGSPQGFDSALTIDVGQPGVPQPFTFDAAFATDVATGGTPHVAPRAQDRALTLDQAAGVVHRAPPPDIPVGQTPLFLTRISTGWPSRAPLTVAALRDRIERMERDLLRLQTNRFSVGPQPNQHDVPVHALSNAAAMGDTSDQHHMAFNQETGQYEPSGPVHSPGPALAGALPPGPPYGFISRVQTGSFVGVIQGGKLQVPFIDDQGNPIPLGNGVMGLVICVGDTERNL